MQHYRNQGGFTLLILVLILLSMAGVIGTNYLNKSLLEIKKKKLNDNQQVLETAKFALLQYAYNFPDFSPTNGGPGRLPCPDNDNDGNAEVVLNCGSGTAGFTMVGRFPYLQMGLNVEDLRDSSGSRLWYAVSHNFSWVKGAPNIINAASEGTISLSDVTGSVINDSSADGGGIVAVIIAPGEKITRYEPAAYTQVRTTAAEQIDPRNYLEMAFGIDNATFEIGDRDTATGVDDVNGFIKGPIYDPNIKAIISNDQFITITRDEIIDFAFKRMTSEISTIIANYQNVFVPPITTLPWLFDGDYTNATLDFVNPDNDIDAVVPFNNRSALAQGRSTEIGFLPLLSDGGTFGTEIILSWDLEGATEANGFLVSDNGFTEITKSELQHVTLNGFNALPYTENVCIWRNGSKISCDVPIAFFSSWKHEVAIDNWQFCPNNTLANCNTGVAVREESLTFEMGATKTLSFNTIVNPPATSVYTAATLNSVDQVQQIIDDATDIGTIISDTNNFELTYSITQYSNKTLGTIDETSTLTIADNNAYDEVAGAGDTLSITTRYYPETSPWIDSNEWNKYMILEYTQGYKPGAAGVDCVTAGVLCLTYNSANGTQANVDALTLFPGAQKRNTALWNTVNIIDYFEAPNTIDNQIYSTDAININDLVEIILP